jgi:hypothetical protein
MRVTSPPAHTLQRLWKTAAPSHQSRESVAFMQSTATRSSRRCTLRRTCYRWRRALRRKQIEFHAHSCQLDVVEERNQRMRLDLAGAVGAAPPARRPIADRRSLPAVRESVSITRMYVDARRSSTVSTTILPAPRQPDGMPTTNGMHARNAAGLPQRPLNRLQGRRQRRHRCQHGSPCCSVITRLSRFASSSLAISTNRCNRPRRPSNDEHSSAAPTTGVTAGCESLSARQPPLLFCD